MRRILVTGGAGFIGSNIAATLAEQGYGVLICDRFRDADLGKWRNLAKHAVVDLVSPDDLAGWLATDGEDLDAIIHMGAVSATTETDVDFLIRSNFNLSCQLWRFAAQSGVRLIYASSAATYGDGSRGFADDNDLDALQALRPLNAYGWSKALFDAYAVRSAMAGVAPPQWAGLKFFNVYGPNEYHKGSMQSVAAQVWPRIADGRTVTLFRSHNPDYPDGGQLRDFIYVRDACDVVSWLLETADVNGVFNLGTGKARSFLDLASAMFRAADLAPDIRYVDTPESIRNQYQYFTQADMNGLRAAGYQRPFTDLESGVADYVRSYLATPDRYR